MMFKQSLGFKIIVLVGIVLIVAFAVFAYAYLQVEEKQMLAKSKQMAELLARTIHRSLSEVMLEGKTYKVQKMMASYKPIEEIDGIRIFDPENGLILVDADKASIGGFVDKRYKFPAVVSRPSQANLSSEGGKRLLHVLTPILNEPKCYRCHKPAKRILGMLDIDISVKNIFEDIAKNRFRMIGFVLMTVTVISLIIALLIRYLVNQPIQQLVTTMNRVESGDLTVEIQTTSRDELGKLARSFNSMIARLCSDVERLEVLHKTSEDFRSTINLDEIENIAVQGIVQGLKFDRAVLLLVNEAEQTLKGKVGIGVVEDVVKRVKIPLDRECGILAETVLDAKPFNVQGGMYDISLAPEKTVKCWEFHNCDESDCPAYGSYDLRCWLQSSTHCNRTVQMSFEDKTEVCCRCQVIREAYGKKAMLVLLMFGSRAFATVPLMAQDKATGVIMVDNLYSRRAITDEDIKELSVFAAQAGMAIENAKLYKRLESRIEAADEELKRKVKALTEMKNFNDSIIQNMSNGLVTINIDGRIVYFNSAAEAILGYKAREAQGQPIGDVI
ncbi:MAG: HAMP domain-containing protein, partial [Candidatus Poribacteria bacterium]